MRLRIVIDKIFVFVSYGMVKGPGLRMRTQFVFMQVIFITFVIGEFALFRLFHVSAKPGAVLLLLSLPFSWLISRFTKSYVNNNWRLFSPKSKDQVQYFWLYRTIVYCFLLILVSGLAFLVVYGVKN